MLRARSLSGVVVCVAARVSCLSENWCERMCLFLRQAVQRAARSDCVGRACGSCPCVLLIRNGCEQMPLLFRQAVQRAARSDCCRTSKRQTLWARSLSGMVVCVTARTSCLSGNRSERRRYFVGGKYSGAVRYDCVGRACGDCSRVLLIGNRCERMRLLFRRKVQRAANDVGAQPCRVWW